MKRILLAAALLVGLCGAAEAACPATSAQMKDNAAATFQMGLTSDVNGNCQSYVTELPGTLAGGLPWVSGTTAAMTGTTSTQIIAAVVSKRLYITRIKCNNSSSSVPTMVQIQDGSGGTVLDTLAANNNFGGEQGTAPTPMFWTTAGNGLYAQDVTTGASAICTASGYSG